MKPRALQIAFLAVSLLFATTVLRHGRPAMLLPAQAQDAAPGPISLAKAADRKAAITVIQAQLKALQKGDYQQVVQYQSSGLRQRFATVAAFRHMMETQYPAFLNFQSVTYGPASTQDGGRHVVVPVTLHKAHGVGLPVVYLVVREGKGYKVDGVGGGMAPPPGTTSGSSQFT